MAEESTQQTTTQMPGPYPFGGEAIWSEYINRFFGDEGKGYSGLLDMLEAQQAERQGAFDTYHDTMTGAYGKLQGDLEHALGAGNRYGSRMNAINQPLLDAVTRARTNTMPVNIGGATFNLAQMGGVNLANKARNAQAPVAANRLQFESSAYPEMASKLAQARMAPAQSAYEFAVNNASVKPQLQFLNQLTPMAEQVQQWRYGTPTQRTSTDTDTDYSTMEKAAGWGQLATGAGGLLNDLSHVDWGGIGEAAGGLWDTVKGWF